MFDFWPVYSGEWIRASGPSCYNTSSDRKVWSRSIAIHTGTAVWIIWSLCIKKRRKKVVETAKLTSVSITLLGINCSFFLLSPMLCLCEVDLVSRMILYVVCLPCSITVWNWCEMMYKRSLAPYTCLNIILQTNEVIEHCLVGKPLLQWWFTLLEG